MLIMLTSELALFGVNGLDVKLRRNRVLLRILSKWERKVTLWKELGNANCTGSGLRLMELYKILWVQKKKINNGIPVDKSGKQ